MTFMNYCAKMCQTSRKIATFSQYPGSLGLGNKSRAAQTFEKSKEMLPVLASAKSAKSAKCDVHGPLVHDWLWSCTTKFNPVEHFQAVEHKVEMVICD